MPIRSAEYYKLAGEQESTANVTYRYKRVQPYIMGNTVLDVGCGMGGFLSLVAREYEVLGIEVNAEKDAQTNKDLNSGVTILSDIESGLPLRDESVDTVTCLEVLEHLHDPRGALEELARVARRRVIVTVPFEETIKTELCIHCGRRTPYWGHLHTFTEQDITKLAPRVTKISLIDVIYTQMTVPTKLYSVKLPAKLCRLPLFHFRLPIFLGFGLKEQTPLWYLVVLDKLGDSGK